MRYSRKSIFSIFLITALLLSMFSATALAADNARMGVVTADKVNIRKEASTDGEVIGRYSQDTRIVITGSKGNFFEVVYNGETGYVSGDFAIVYDYDKGKISATNVILREGPNTDSDRLATMDKGDSVNVYGEDNGFYRVTYGAQAGYVSKDFVSFGGDSSSSSSKGEAKAKSGGKYARSPKSGEFSEGELYLVAQLICCEGGRSAATASYKALASVVYNRVVSRKFPSSVEGVVFQDGQFSVVNDREKFLDTKPSRKCQDAVYSVFVEGELSLPADVLFFKSDSLSREWGAREYYATIGGNMYYT